MPREASRCWETFAPLARARPARSSTDRRQEGQERAARLAAILVGESPYDHRSPVDAVVISNNEKGD